MHRESQSLFGIRLRNVLPYWRCVRLAYRNDFEMPAKNVISGRSGLSCGQLEAYEFGLIRGEGLVERVLADYDN
jgi:hypothetical protein